jgi:hypothetical protein
MAIDPKHMVHLTGGEYNWHALKKTAQGADEAFVATFPHDSSDDGSARTVSKY